MIKMYRLHYTCIAGHTSYIDYKQLKTAIKNIQGRYRLGQDWYWYKLEVITYGK